MRNIFSGFLAGILILISIILLAATVYSLYVIFLDPLPVFEMNQTGLYEWLRYFEFPLLALGAFLYVVTLLFTTLRIQQVNDSFRIIRKEVFEADKPRLFLKPLNINFITDAGLGKLSFKFNERSSPAIQIINAGKEPALEVRSKFSFDLKSSIKLIKTNDLFHLFIIEENDNIVTIKSEKLAYSSSKETVLLNNWQKNDFILPSRHNPLSSEVIVPEIYTELFFWYNEITNGDRINEFPELRCNIEYRRINSSVTNQTFGIKLAEADYSPGLRGDKLYDSSSMFITELKLI